MIQVQSTEPREALEGDVDQELEKFNEWLLTLEKGGPLSRIERAIIKTYLAWKLGVANGT